LPDHDQINPNKLNSKFNGFSPKSQGLRGFSSIQRPRTMPDSIVDVKVYVQLSLSWGRFEKELAPHAGLIPDCVNQLAWQA
jgi:hypothetical protein